MLANVQCILDLYETRGHECHGSGAVSQLEHAQQCAALAQRDGAGVGLVCAAFLHDCGHLLAPQPRFIAREIDDLHQYVALPFLRPLFGADVLEPIRLHVDAKRYLCGAEAGYRERLRPVSQHSLQLQGGALSGAEASAFLRRRFANEAIRLRRWDDEAKVSGLALPDLATMAAVLEAAAGCHKTAMAGA